MRISPTQKHDDTQDSLSSPTTGTRRDNRTAGPNSSPGLQARPSEPVSQENGASSHREDAQSRPTIQALLPGQKKKLKRPLPHDDPCDASIFRPLSFLNSHRDSLRSTNNRAEESIEPRQGSNSDDEDSAQLRGRRSAARTSSSSKVPKETAYIDLTSPSPPRKRQRTGESTGSPNARSSSPSPPPPPPPLPPIQNHPPGPPLRNIPVQHNLSFLNHHPPSRQQIPNPAVQHRQLTRGLVNPAHPNPHLRGFRASAPEVQEPDPASTTCTQRQRHFAPREWLAAVRRTVGRNPKNKLHGGQVKSCDNDAAHASPSSSAEPEAKVCLACRVASHLHVVHEHPDLLEPFYWPLCKTCGHEATADPEQRRGCSCGEGWLCPGCYQRALEDTQVIFDAEFEVRKSCMGIECRCGVELWKPEERAPVRVRQCAGCLGIVNGRWTEEMEGEVLEKARRMRFGWVLLGGGVSV